VSKERDVLEEDLLLKILRRRGDDDSASGEHGRHEVGQRLSGPSAGLRHQVAAVVEDALHGSRQGELLRSVLVPVQRGLDGPARSQQRFDGERGPHWISDTLNIWRTRKYSATAKTATAAARMN